MHGNFYGTINWFYFISFTVLEVNIVCQETCDFVSIFLSFFIKLCFCFCVLVRVCFLYDRSYNKLCISWKNIFCSCCSYNHIADCLRVGYFVFDLNVCFFFICIFVFCTLLFSFNNFRHIASYISFCLVVGNSVPGEFVFTGYCFEKWKLSVCIYCCDHVCFCGRSHAKVNFVCSDADHFGLFLIRCFFTVLFGIFSVGICINFFVIYFTVLFGIFSVGICTNFFVIYFTVFYVVLIVFIIICCRGATPYKCVCCGSC